MLLFLFLLANFLAWLRTMESAVRLKKVGEEAKGTSKTGWKRQKAGSMRQRMGPDRAITGRAFCALTLAAAAAAAAAANADAAADANADAAADAGLQGGDLFLHDALNFLAGGDLTTAQLSSGPRTTPRR